MEHVATETRKDTQTARAAGRQARHNGARNPHKPGTAANNEWAGGWHEEDDAAADADDTALLAACREFEKQRGKALKNILADGKTGGWKWFDLRETIRATTPVTEQGAAARSRIVDPPVPSLPLTGTNTAVDVAVERVRELMAVEEVTGRAHTEAENALMEKRTTRAARAEAKANRIYIASQEVTEAARCALLDLPVFTLQEARTRLHAYVLAMALYTLPSVLWRVMPLEEAIDVIHQQNLEASLLALGLTTYVADVERVTAEPAPPPSDPSDWSTARDRCDEAEAAFLAVCSKFEAVHPSPDEKAQIAALRDTYVAARDAMLFTQAPDLTALIYKMGAHPDLPEMRLLSDLYWHAELGDKEERMWAAILLDARALAAQQVAVSPTMAALGAEFERRWALERAVYEDADRPDPDASGDAAVEYTGAIVGQIEAQPLRTIGDLGVLARLVAWAHGGIEDLRRDFSGETSTADDLTLLLLNRLLGEAPAPTARCSAAALITPYAAAVRAEEEAGLGVGAQLCDHRDNLAVAGSEVVASSITGVLFQLSLASFHLHRAHDMDHEVDYAAAQKMFRHGQTALLNASKALSGITGVRLSEAGWDADVLEAIDSPPRVDWSAIGDEWQAKRDRAETSLEFDVPPEDWPTVEPIFTALADERDALEDHIIDAPCDGPVIASLKLRVALERVRRDDGHSNWTDQGDVRCINSVLAYFTGQPSALAMRPVELPQ